MPEACDCHFHVIGPHAQFPLLPGRSYTPAEAPLQAWQAALQPLGVSQGVVVQPSVYGTDNRALLATLAEGAQRLVGVAAVNSDIGEQDLDDLAAAGVRGVRLSHFEAGDARGLAGFVPLAQLDRLAPRLRARGLHVNLFTDSRLLAEVAPALRAARLPVVIDHMGRTPAALGAAHAGVAHLRKLLDEGWCWVKLSGLANISARGPDFPDVRPLHDLLVAHHGDRLVWGSDWPQTRAHGAATSTAQLLERFRDWTPDEGLQLRILSENPKLLYGFKSPSGQANR